MPHLTRAKLAERAAREARLAKALRENLHRRKQQARAQQPDDAAATDADPETRPGQPPA